ncbi:tyrosine-type recombinase/integrase [Pasteurella multocida]|uniref:tyrosine-type recombinase/integrase n=1 Tax=Pasteurella multocida TaxID=747 RepID=UPI00210D2EA6|nr:tyrosine-type recombinase/integrase [Pasteurella multocida]MDC4236231.1 tyrosine-type recombinase/integrase [Pasteurella multocida]
MLIQKMAEIDRAVDFGIRIDRTFAEAATRYLSENENKPSIKTIIIMLESLMPFIGELTLKNIHDGTLQKYIEYRKKHGKTKQAKNGVKNRTINAALEVVIRILNLASRKWRDDNGITWLEVPPSISKLNENEGKRKPYPLSWFEQRILMGELPEHLRNMALFKVNTGTREQEVCNLRWDWEVYIPEIKQSVFLIPENFGGRDGNGGVKNKEERLVVLNSVASSVIQRQRGKHPIYVFTYKGKPLTRMYNTAWKKARTRASTRFEKETGVKANVGLMKIRVHDLKHTFGHRLRAAGVVEEDRKTLLGHKSRSITTHYSAPDVEKLVEFANRVNETDGTQRQTLTILRRKTA